MASYATLKAALQAVIKQNGNNEITGDLLQQALFSMVNSLGAGYQFMGVAVLTPTPTNPGTPDQNVFYIASEPGTYTNFSGVEIGENEVAILKWNGSWVKETTGSATVKFVDALKQKTYGFSVYDGIVHEQGVTDTEFYSSCIQELFLFPEIVKNVDWVDLRSYFGIYLYGWKGEFSNNPEFSFIIANPDVSQYSDGDVIPLITTQSTDEIAAGTTIGYLVFKNKSAFFNRRTGSLGNTCSLSFIANLGNAPTVLKSMLEIEQIYQDIDDVKAETETLDTYVNGHIYDGIIHEIGTTDQAFYESCIAELFVKPEIADNVDWLDVRSYGALYVYGWNGPFSSSPGTFGVVVAGQSLVGVSDGDVIPMVATETTSLANQGDVIGYIVFKNVYAFRNKYTGSLGNTLNRNWVNRQSNFPIISNFIVNGSDDDALEITIPNTVYAIVGTELNIWNDTVSLSADKGLASPANYQIEWLCAKGTIVERGFRFTPTVDDIGTVQCTCKLYDMQYKLIALKTFTIKVVAKNALASAKNIVYFGDSTGADAAIELYNNFHDSDKFTGTPPTMFGTRGGVIRYEAVGGYRWEDYATAGRRAFRCQVTGVGAIALYSQYTNNGFTWTVVEVNVTSGTGNILITKDDVGGTDAPQTNGTLVPVGSGDSIQYTNATLEGANPLWNANTQSLDVALYRQRIGLTDGKIDAVSFQLGLNEPGDTQENIVQYITNLYNAFIADNPNCIFILGLVTSAGNTLDGFGANYGASFSQFAALQNFYRERHIYLSFLGKTGFGKLRIATPNLSLDRYFGYQFGTRNISQRFTGVTLPDDLTLNAKEVYHTNWVHPAGSGYGQMADAFFAAYVATLTE